MGILSKVDLPVMIQLERLCLGIQGPSVEQYQEFPTKSIFHIIIIAGPVCVYL